MEFQTLDGKVELNLEEILGYIKTLGQVMRQAHFSISSWIERCRARKELRRIRNYTLYQDIKEAIAHQFSKLQCPECKDGRIITRTEELRSSSLAPIEGEFKYMLPEDLVKVPKLRETNFCDICDYQTVREYVEEKRKI